MSYWIRVGGMPATEIAPHSAPTWETWADGGNGLASWEMGRSAKFQHQSLAPDTLASIHLGPKRVWWGRIEDYNRNTGEVSCRGIHTDTLGIPALDGGATTRSAAAALVTAVGSPWFWQVNDPNGFITAMGSAQGDDTSPLMLAELFDQIADQTGKRWGQDADAQLYFRADPTDPTWLIAPESAAFGVTGEGGVTHLVAVYDNGTTYATITRNAGVVKTARAELVDLTDRGTLTSGQVTTILDNALAALKPRQSWLNGSEIPLSRVTTIGGTPAHGASVRAGAMAQAHGFTVAGQAAALTMRAVIGKTRYTAGSKTIYLEPINTAPRTFADVIADAGNKRGRA